MGAVASCRVAAYCRVSTDGGDQSQSLHSQRQYFTQYIQSQPHWHFVDIYADEGFSGTDTKHRSAFCAMLRHAQAGKMDLILTKEVSRFARNTVDALTHTRALKGLGVGVYFINDGIDTRADDGELRLTIMASMAQEESRKTSQRVRWGQSRQMERGVVFGGRPPYGFRREGGTLAVDFAQSQVVRQVYHQYLYQSKGAHTIARALNEQGVLPPSVHGAGWSPEMVRNMLRNEKYMGDLVQKKWITTDYLTHKREKNRGQEEVIHLKNHHAAIVDRALWQGVQEEMARRSTKVTGGVRHSNRHWCTGKIHCGLCGATFVPRQEVRASGALYRSWGCGHRLGYNSGVRCPAPMVNHKVAVAVVEYLLEEFGVDRTALATQVVEDCQKGVQAVAETEKHRLTQQRAGLDARRNRLMEGYLSGLLTAQQLTQEEQRLVLALENLTEEERPFDGTQAVAYLAMVCQSERYLGEALERITVYRDYIGVQLLGCDEINLSYQTQGAGATYRVHVAPATVPSPTQYPQQRE